MASKWRVAERTPLEALMTLFILLVALFLGFALAIEAGTGRPAKIVIQEWWKG